MIDSAALKTYFTGLQTHLVAALETLEGEQGGRLRSDAWQKEPGQTLAGYGQTCIIEGGRVFERGGVGFSHVSGTALPASATAKRPELAGCAFEAMGVSLVLHPENPYCPTAHMNVRCFVATKEGEAPVWWFGGGMDMTPYYGQREDVVHFHAPAAMRWPLSGTRSIRDTSSGATSISFSSTATSRAGSAASSSMT